MSAAKVTGTTVPEGEDFTTMALFESAPAVSMRKRSLTAEVAFE